MNQYYVLATAAPAELSRKRSHADDDADEVDEAPRREAALRSVDSCIESLAQPKLEMNVGW